MASVYIALLHHPVYNKKKDVVSTCITGFDLHDIARTALTYGVKKYYVVNPLPAQRQFARRIFDFWMDENSLEFNWTRAEAFKLISIKGNLGEVMADLPLGTRVVATSAKAKGKVKFGELRREIRAAKSTHLLLFGTGWGLAEEIFEKVDATLEPIAGISEYNHLPVRSAVAIILDRLLGS